MFFELSEYKVRLQKTRERMDNEGIDILIVTHPANMNYLSGYDGWSFYTHQGLLILIDENEPIWFGREQDSNGARLTTWLKEKNIYGYPDDYVQSTTKHPMSFAVNILKKRAQNIRHIGVEMDNYYFTAKCYEQLREDLPNSTIKDATLLIPIVRQIKSEQEIFYMKQAARIVERAMQTAIDAIQEGVREGDAAARVYYSQISGTDKYTGDYTAIAPIMPSAERTSTAHLTWTDRRYERGDIVF